MKIASYTLVIASALLFAACSEDQKNETTTTSATVPAANVNQAQPAQTPGKAVALNPPHGEPGHNCAIPVGAPLDGPPLPRLVKPNLSPVPSQTPPGMNPPHGQPGHDCAIPVGAPLGKK
ncbi:hypothetical protein POKO110462_07575 [Pontibacter korlensis]|uniref:Lipoprotein n=1 Tax=Pontibacter korlensis TaxID=400092 RepID=A0A0E3UVY6_9BACT|nr:hypothetical protein [Pontibacter korlensis]AKD02246.1 hypothetical protein PKOR_02730 [Pontibacter korlensis]